MIRLTNGDEFAVARLLEDEYGAFIGASVRPGPQNGSFEWLKIEVCCVDVIQCVDDLIDKEPYSSPVEALPRAYTHATFSGRTL